MSKQRIPKSIIKLKEIYVLEQLPTPSLDKILYAGGYELSYITVPYSDLVEEFGQPTSNGDEYYNDAEWIIETPDGLTLIHNHKNGQNFLGPKGPATKDITEWVIRGVSPEALRWIEMMLAPTS